MGRVLDQAIEEARKLPEADQEAIGEWLLGEIDERRWDELFAHPSPIIERMAQEALEEHRRGRTTLLDPDTI